VSKEELLKYLIAEIDLIMHDKDYRFENQDGTWYSRESCRDLTNEEVFEELKCELRQLADLEAKLAEKEKENELMAKTLKMTKFIEKEVTQEKISFAVERLVNIQKYISDNPVGAEQECFGREINEFIDNQIEQLKEIK
jgi:hypothetical protein